MYMNTTHIEDEYLKLIRLSLKRLALIIFGSLICLATISIAQASPNIIVTTNKPIYEIGDSSTVYTISGAQPNSPIYWSSWKNGVSTGETLAFYGHYTDANGKVTLATNTAWGVSERGFWKKQATIGAKSSYITFYVIPKLTVNASMYTVGSQPFYSVTGAPPYSPIYWSSWINGVSTGETDTFYGHYTDANGNFSSFGGQWLSSHVGYWKKQVKIGAHVSPVEFVVNSSNNLKAHATKFTPRSQAFFTLTGAFANYPIYWTTYLNGAIVYNNYFRGDYTNSSGGWTGVTSPFLPSEVGHWVVNLSVGGIIYSTSFYVGPTSLNTFTQIAGSYSWYPSNAGLDTRASVDAKRMGDLGARVHRLLFEPTSMQCAGESTLRNTAQSDDMKKALSDPRISTYVLTIGKTKDCYAPGTKHWNPILFNPAFYPSYSDLVRNDIKNLTTYLYQTYKGTGKKFILSHWEMDNGIRCSNYDRHPDGLGEVGGVLAYHNNIRNIRSYCDGKTNPQLDVPRIFNIRKYDDSDYADSDEQYDGYRRFLELYQQGVSLGKDAATAQMWGGVEVYHAPEGAAVNLLYTEGHKNLIRDVIPYIDYDYISYSSYETTNYNPGESDAFVTSRIQADLNTISNIAIPSSGGYFKNIIIGEFGQPYRLADNTIVDSSIIQSRYANVLNTLMNWNVAYVFNWHLYREDVPVGLEGIYTNAGAITPLGVYYRNRFGQYYF